MNKICVLCHAINAELATVCHYCGAALGEAPHEGAAMREQGREPSPSKPGDKEE